MALNFDKYSISSIDSVVGFNPATKECLFILDEIKDGTLEGGAEIVWATGKEGRRLTSLKRNKTCKFSCSNGFIVGGVLAQQLGGSPEEDFDVASIVMPAFEHLRVGTTDVVKTEFVATGIVGNEITFIYKANSDGTQGKKFAQGAAVDAETFTYDPITQEIALPTGAFEENDIVIVFYERKTKGRKYTNRSDTYASDIQVVLDVMIKDICTGAEKHSKLVIPKATVDDNFSYAFGSELSVQSFACEAAASICSGESEYFYWVFPAFDD